MRQNKLICWCLFTFFNIIPELVLAGAFLKGFWESDWTRAEVPEKDPEGVDIHRVIILSCGETATTEKERENKTDELTPRGGVWSANQLGISVPVKSSGAMWMGVPTMLPDIMASGLQKPRSVIFARFCLSNWKWNEKNGDLLGHIALKKKKRKWKCIFKTETTPSCLFSSTIYKLKACFLNRASFRWRSVRSQRWLTKLWLSIILRVNVPSHKLQFVTEDILRCWWRTSTGVAKRLIPIVRPCQLWQSPSMHQDPSWPT